MYVPRSFPVSIKGVCVRDGRVLLLKNEREEWELPGGKLELDEQPPERLQTEIAEEIGWSVTIGPILDAWQYHIRDGVDVLIVTYGCFVSGSAPMVVSREHIEAGLFARDELSELALPTGYRDSIAAWFDRLESDVAS